MLQGRAYRRGTVAGLSLGEIFILLSFVLMMAVLLISEEARREGPLGHVGVVHAKSDTVPDPETVKALSEEAEHTRAELEQALAREKRLKSGYEGLAEALARERTLRRQAETDADDALGQAEADASAQEELAKEIAAHAETKAAFAEAEEENATLREEAEGRATSEAALGEALAAVEAMEEAQAKDAEAHAEEQAVVQDYITQLKGTVVALTEQVEVARKGEEEAQADLEAAMRETQAARQAAAKAREAERKGRQSQRKAAGALEDERRARQAAEAKVAALKEETDRRESAGQHADKGVDPPCWYVRVATANGGDREKALYAIDIAIHDHHIVLGRRNPPSGGPDRGESGSYRAEYDALGIGKLPYGKRLGNEEIRRALAPIRDAGNSGRVRSYPCKFYAQVWDRTGAASKSRWQQAHANVIQQYFNTYVVQDTPWRH